MVIAFAIDMMREECKDLLIIQFEAMQWMAIIFGGAILVIFLMMFWVIHCLENIDRRLSREEMYRDGIKQV
jgi:hypothetical protein